MSQIHSNEMLKLKWQVLSANQMSTELVRQSAPN